MSLQNEDRSSLDKATETSGETQRRAKITYSRNFLLSLSKLEICKKLPSGFDGSNLSDFEDASHSNQDQQRSYGSLTLQGFRRIEYGSSPPNRGDLGNYTQGTYGRWDNRSSGRSDRDSDLQSDQDSDSGRRYSNHSRRSWQVPEHDGLLGRPSGYGAGTSAPKVRANDQYQLNRSNELYHPPRPYKAAPLLRRDTHDSYNDETFGSAECTSEDRVEEERRRRASFELMRKEQKKALQVKQKVNLEKHKADSVSDISTLLDDSKEEKRVLDPNDELDAAATESIASINSGKSVLPSQTPTCRPLVPPGFKNMVLEKNLEPKSLTHSHSAEIGKNETEECLVDLGVQNGTLSGSDIPALGEISEQQDSKSICLPVFNKFEEIPSSYLKVDMSSLEAHRASNELEINEFNVKKSGLKLGGEFKENDTTSILEKIFGNASMVNASNTVDPIQHHNNKSDDSWSPKPVHSSRFACWFVEEERKTEDDFSSSRPNNLLSLIVSGDECKSHKVKVPESFPSEFSHQSSELANNLPANMFSATNGVSKSLNKSIKQEVAPAILTCEDLEQTILSDYGDEKSKLQPPTQGSQVLGAKSERPGARVDDHASQHLLSLLQKGVSQENMTQKIHADVDPLEKLSSSDVHDIGTSLYKTREEDAKNINTSGNTPTIETLFGTAFMKELHSVDAPISVQRGSVGSEQADTVGLQGSVISVTDNSLFPSEIDPVGSEKMSNAKNFLALNPRAQNKLDKTEEWLGYDDPQIELDLSKHRPNLAGKDSGFDGAVEYQLPEEENLLAVSDDLNPQLSKFLRGNLNQNEALASNKSGDMLEKLAAIGATIKDERHATGSDGPPFLRSPYNQIERDVPFCDLHSETSSLHFQSPQMSPGRPLLQQLDSLPAHMNSQLKFMGPERVIQHDASANHQFPATILRPPFHQPNVGVRGFDLPAHRPMLQQMQISGNYPHHLVNDSPRGNQFPHPGSQAMGYMQELKPMPGYPFGLRKPNIGGLGMPMPAPNINGDGGSNHPEAFQRLIEMELRAKPKQIPSVAVGHSQGMYSSDLEMMRYR